MSKLSIALLTATSVCGNAIAAETSTTSTTDKVVAAQVIVADDCGTASYPQPTGARSAAPQPLRQPIDGAGSFPAPLVPVVAGILGDVASSGLKAAASALAKASSAKAIGGEGIATFNFYATAGDGKTLTSRLAVGGAGCLMIIVTPTARNANSDWAIAGRFILETHADGFVVRPFQLSYNTAPPGAPSTKSLPLELHAVFSVPSKQLSQPTDEATFAVARIRLPAMKPGQTFNEDELEGYSSHAMPFRPAPDKIKAGMAAGTTSVLARLVILKSANAFGQSLATALGARSEALGTAVTTTAEQAINPAGFGDADAAYALARVTVRHKEAALKLAQAGGNQAEIDKAELALAEAQAQANVKAAAAKRLLPYEDLLD